MRLLKGNGSDEDDRLFAPVMEMAEELNRAQILIISCPMWNFSFPYVVKQFIDIALQPGETKCLGLVYSGHDPALNRLQGVLGKYLWHGS